MTTPIEIPSQIGFSSKVFRLSYRQQITPGGGGALQTIDRRSPFWVAEFTTPALSDTNAGVFESFLDALEGSRNPFLAYDPQKRMPLAYSHLPTSADPWKNPSFASPRITAVSHSNSSLTLDRMAVGAVLSQGDYISVYVAPAWHLFRLAAGGVTSDSTVIVYVKPRPTFSVVFPLDIRYRKACCAMKVIGQPDIKSSVGQGTVFSFRAAQHIEQVPA